MNTITLTPAYGRDYKSKAAVLADWDANKDFMINHIRLARCALIWSPTPCHGGYVSKSQINDLKLDGFSHITFRYSRCTKVFIVQI